MTAAGRSPRGRGWRLSSLLWLLFAMLLLSSWIQQVHLVNAEDAGGAAEAHMYLYLNDRASTGFVQEYTGPRREGDFQNDQGLKIVEFYSPYCGHCIHFKPTYIKLAQDIQARHGNLVRFYAVSCNAHRPICQEYKLSGWPAMLAFRNGDRQGQPLTESKFQKEYTVEMIEEALGLPTVSQAEDENADVDGDGTGIKDPIDQGEEEEDAANQDERVADLQELRRNTRDRNNNNNRNDEEEVEEQEQNAPAGEEDTNEEAGDRQQQVMENDEEEEEDKPRPPKRNNFQPPVQEEEENDEDQGNEQKVDVFGEEEERQSEQASPDNTNEDKPSEDASLDKEEVEKEAEDGSLDDEDEDKKLDRLVPHVPQPGALLARKHGNAEINKWRDHLRETLQERKQQEQAGFSRFRMGASSSQGGKAVDASNMQQFIVPEGATDGMKAHTPGTSEYTLRNQMIRQKVLEISRKTRRSTPVITRSSAAGGGPTRKHRLPFRKVVTKPRIAERLPVVKHWVKLSHEETLILDSSLSFVHGLRYGLFKKRKPLSSKEKRALKDWLDLMRISLPPEWGLHELIDDLEDNLDFISQNSNNLNSILDKFPTPRVLWSRACGQGLQGQGFSCGFWKLLHIVSVGVAEHKGGVNLIKGKLLPADTRTFSPLEAANTIREYMAHFFLCEPCSQHFIGTYDQCDNNRRCARLAKEVGYTSDADWKELAKWLWEVHNDVSVRLMHERSKSSQGQRPPIAAALWPMVQDCARCLAEDGSWDEDAVFLHLEQIYWPGAIFDPKSDRLLQLVDDEYVTESRLTAFLGFMLLCLLFVMRKSLSKEGLYKTLFYSKKYVRPKQRVV